VGRGGKQKDIGQTSGTKLTKRVPKRGKVLKKKINHTNSKKEEKDSQPSGEGKGKKKEGEGGSQNFLARYEGDRVSFLGIHTEKGRGAVGDRGEHGNQRKVIK